MVQNGKSLNYEQGEERKSLENKKGEERKWTFFICITCLLYVNRLFKWFYGDVTHVNLSFRML